MKKYPPDYFILNKCASDLNKQMGYKFISQLQKEKQQLCSFKKTSRKLGVLSPRRLMYVRGGKLINKTAPLKN